ncbi:DUF4202 domain-containing protein [Thalassotalea agarivorans]|nr:DUF4202 domain-containing protein [Thalassotalea agarivorans]
MTEQLNQTLTAIDAINEQDPNTLEVNGEARPKSLLYGHQMTEVLNAYWPNANEYLQIAVRAQHVKRWAIARDEYELGKKGYLAWRKALAVMHAEIVVELMEKSGYNDDEIQQTASIVRKEKLKSNADSQTLEDVACLVFLMHYFNDFATKYDDDKLVDIVQKTWRKMSEQGHEIALSLTLPAHLAAIVGKALQA